MGTIFVDFDDTLFFTKHLVEEVIKTELGDISYEEFKKLPKQIKSKIYEKAFTEFYHKAKPNKKLIALLREYKNKGYTIIILTGRLENTREVTEKLLSLYNVPYDKLVMRSDLSKKDEEWKAEIIAKYKDKEKVIFEDKLENILHIKEKVDSIRAFLVNGDEIKEIA